MVLHVRGVVLPEREERSFWIDGDVLRTEPVPGAETVVDGGWLVPGLVDTRTHPGTESLEQPFNERDLRRHLVQHRDAGVLLVRTPGTAARMTGWVDTRTPGCPGCGRRGGGLPRRGGSSPDSGGTSGSTSWRQPPSRRPPPPPAGARSSVTGAGANPPCRSTCCARPLGATLGFGYHYGADIIAGVVFTLTIDMALRSFDRGWDRSAKRFVVHGAAVFTAFLASYRCLSTQMAAHPWVFGPLLMLATASVVYGYARITRLSQRTAVPAHPEPRREPQREPV